MTKVLRNDKEASKWSSIGNEMIKCPFPGCDHIGLMITKIHCRMEHGMSREEIQTAYGFPKRVAMKNLKGTGKLIPSYNRLRKSDY